MPYVTLSERVDDPAPVRHRRSGPGPGDIAEVRRDAGVDSAAAGAVDERTLTRSPSKPFHRVGTSAAHGVRRALRERRLAESLDADVRRRRGRATAPTQDGEVTSSARRQTETRRIPSKRGRGEAPTVPDCLAGTTNRTSGRRLRPLDTLSRVSAPGRHEEESAAMAVTVVLSEVQRAALAALCDTYRRAGRARRRPDRLLGAQRVGPADPGDHRGPPVRRARPGGAARGAAAAARRARRAGPRRGAAAGARGDRQGLHGLRPRRARRPRRAEGPDAPPLLRAPRPVDRPQPELGGDRLPRAPRRARRPPRRRRRRSP